MIPRAWTGALAGAALFTGLVAGASAQDLGVELEVIEPEDEDDEDVEDEDVEERAPYFRAQIDINRPGLTAGDFVLEDLDADPPVRQEASDVTRYRDGDQPMAMIVLIQGNFRWMGNEMYLDPDDPDLYEGAFRGLGPAIDVLAEAGPEGSKAGLYVYQIGEAKARQPLDDASSLTSAALGSQREYDGIDRPFLVALEEVWRLLADASGYRRILVVIGDGTDDVADISGDLRSSIQQFQDIGAEVYTIHYAAYTDSDEQPVQGQDHMRNLGYSGQFQATSRDSIRSHAESIVGQIGARYFVEFPGDEFLFDGETHEMLIEAGGRETTQAVALPVFERPEPDEGGSLAWLWWLLGILLLVGIVVAIVIVLKNRPAKAPPPPVVEQPAAPAPAKTVMLGAGGNEDAMPIVGWIVPLAGPTQYHTFKLLQGSTKMGTGGESHIWIEDHYMSTEHAEIVCTPAGFVLQDLGSTNGVYVNQQRIQSHELVDNDVFTLGQTEFKFKSIN